MRTIGLVLTLVLGSPLTCALSAQDVQAQLDGRVSPEVRRAVRSIAASWREGPTPSTRGSVRVR